MLARIPTLLQTQVVFKPGLLGVLTLMRLQERLRNDPAFRAYTHVFYNEADQVMH